MIQRILLLISITLITSIQAQSIKELVEQAGDISTSTIPELQDVTLPDTLSALPAEIPAETTIELEPISPDTMEIKQYGYDYFSNRSTLILLDNLPAPSKYMLGPGDEIIITLWGETELREKATISRDGSIYLGNVGLVNLTGLSLEQARRELRVRFEKVYSTLRGGSSASTFMEVSLGTLKSINVHFLGEVNTPGVLSIHPFSTVTTALIQAGGVSVIGSLRDIRIIRDGETIASLDFYSYLQSGSRASDIRLVDNDIISVPIRKNSIQISGKIRKPGVFELLDDESLDDLIRFAGGLPNDAGTRVEINRILPLEYRQNQDDIITNIWIDLIGPTDTNLLDGDRITIHPLITSELTVHVEGTVKNPGSFALSSDMRVRDLLELSGGVFTSDHWMKVYPYRADLMRHDPYTARSKIIPIRLDKLKDGQEDQNLLLEEGDELIIYPVDINNYENIVRIHGDVRNPGEYSLAENMGLTDLILRAGGFNFSAYPAEVVINSIDPFNINSTTLSTEVKVKIEPDIFSSYPELGDRKLKHLDQVFVRKHPEFQIQRNIILEGEIRFPGTYALEKKDETLESVIERAGGFTDEAFIEGLRISRSEKRLILERKGGEKVDLDLPLRPADQIFVPKHVNTVEVLGEVNSPGLIQYHKGRDVKDYIEIAGGYTLDADRSSIAVYYANGESKNRLLMIDPAVREGSMIVVYKKPEELPLDKTTLVTDVTTIVIQSLSLLLVANRLIQ